MLNRMALDRHQKRCPQIWPRQLEKKTSSNSNASLGIKYVWQVQPNQVVAFSDSERASCTKAREYKVKVS